MCRLTFCESCEDWHEYGCPRPPKVRNIRMVELKDRSDYRRSSAGEVERMLEAGVIRLEGVDGDEYANTVTYWYTRDVEEE